MRKVPAQGPSTWVLFGLVRYEGLLFRSWSGGLGFLAAFCVATACSRPDPSSDALATARPARVHCAYLLLRCLPPPQCRILHNSLPLHILEYVYKKTAFCFLRCNRMYDPTLHQTRSRPRALRVCTALIYFCGACPPPPMSHPAQFITFAHT